MLAHVLVVVDHQDLRAGVQRDHLPAARLGRRRPLRLGGFVRDHAVAGEPLAPSGQRPQDDLRLEPAAVLAYEAACRFVAAPLQGVLEGSARLAGHDVGLGEQLGKSPAHDFLLGISQQSARACIPGPDISLGIEDDDRVVGQVFDEKLQQLPVVRRHHDSAPSLLTRRSSPASSMARDGRDPGRRWPPRGRCG